MTTANVCSLGLKVDNTFSGVAVDRGGFLLVFHVWVMAPRRKWMAFLEPDDDDESSGNSAGCGVDSWCAPVEPLRTDELIKDLVLVEAVLDIVDLREDPEPVLKKRTR